MIKIIRVGRERLREAYEIVNKVDQEMNVGMVCCGTI